eukprot:2119167-Rhodomonas_salina.1
MLIRARRVIWAVLLRVSYGMVLRVGAKQPDLILSRHTLLCLHHLVPPYAISVPHIAWQTRAPYATPIPHTP